MKILKESFNDEREVIKQFTRAYFDFCTKDWKIKRSSLLDGRLVASFIGSNDLSKDIHDILEDDHFHTDRYFSRRFNATVTVFNAYDCAIFEFSRKDRPSLQNDYYFEIVYYDND